MKPELSVLQGEVQLRVKSDLELIWWKLMAEAVLKLVQLTAFSHRNQSRFLSCGGNQDKM